MRFLISVVVLCFLAIVPALAKNEVVTTSRAMVLHAKTTVKSDAKCSSGSLTFLRRFSGPESTVFFDAFPLFSGKKVAICAFEANTLSYFPKICTDARFDVKTLDPKDKTGVLVTCGVGNMNNIKAVVGTFRGSRVMYTLEPLVSTFPPEELFKHVETVGYYLGITLNDQLSVKQMSALWEMLSVSNLERQLNDKKKQSIRDVFSLIGDVAAAVGGVKGKVIGYIIKGIVALSNMSDDPKDDDWLKFLQVYKGIAQLKLKCGTDDDAAILQCIQNERNQGIGSGSDRVFHFQNCVGSGYKSDHYIQLYQEDAAGTPASPFVTTGGGGMVSDSPLYNLCTNDLGGTRKYFEYHKLNFDPKKKICAKLMLRKGLFRDDAFVASSCADPRKTMKFTFNGNGANFSVDVEAAA